MMRFSWFASIKKAVPMGPEGLVWWLALVQASGMTAVLPILPLYADQHGADLTMIGIMVGAYMAANLVGLPPAGWLSDRMGRRRLMAVGLLGFALASFGFLIFTSPTAFIILRACEGLAAACFTPAALAYVADRAPEGQRGQRIAQLTVAQNSGMLLGPVFGGALVMAFGLSAPFWALAVLCAVGGLLVAKLPGAGRADAEARREVSGGRDPVGIWKQVQWLPFAGLSLRVLANGFAIGMYESIWAIYLKDLGGNAWQISLSWTFFALPAIVLAGIAGRTIDRMGPARPLVLGALYSAVLVLSYGMTQNVNLLIFLGVVEGIGFAFAYPAQSAMMVMIAPEALRGRVIGLITAMSTVGALIGAMLTPILYKNSPFWVFAVTAGLLFVTALMLALSVVWARRLPPRATTPGIAG
jgi:DHA1 family multidrug resistance protein-like MFS transporter